MELLYGKENPTSLDIPKSYDFNSIAPYIYMYIHLPTGMYYIGSRYGNVRINKSPIDDFTKYYFGSSYNTDVKFNKETLDEFDFILLATFGDESRIDPVLRMHHLENILIKEHIDNDKCINSYWIDIITGNEHYRRINDYTKEYVLYNVKTSETFKGNIRDIKHKLGCNRVYDISKFIRGQNKTLRGWSLTRPIPSRVYTTSGIKILCNNQESFNLLKNKGYTSNNTKAKIKLFINKDGRTYRGTYTSFKNKFNIPKPKLSEILNKKYQHEGWKLYDDYFSRKTLFDREYTFYNKRLKRVLKTYPSTMIHYFKCNDKSLEKLILMEITMHDGWRILR